MSRLVRLAAIALILLPSPRSTTNAAQEKKTAAGEEFFLIASIDQSKSQLLLKRPTEVTVLAEVGGKTSLLDEKGHAIRLSDLRAGDTVWAETTGGEDKTTVVRLRKGPMTVAQLHHYYLDYPEIAQ